METEKTNTDKNNTFPYFACYWVARKGLPKTVAPNMYDDLGKVDEYIKQLSKESGAGVDVVAVYSESCRRYLISYSEKKGYHHNIHCGKCE